MIEKEVERLYDRLFIFQKKKEIYPIHKSLNLSQYGIEDIYDWVIKKVEIKSIQSALDAGCGVGYGSLKLAQAGIKNITSISLSNSEISQFKQNLQTKGFTDQIKAKVESYDDICGNYDLIIAVESLKHSKKLSQSISNLYSQLNEGGKMIVVEDFFIGKKKGGLENKFQEDWVLQDLYKLEDYKHNFNGEFHDFTSSMSTKSKFISLLKYHLFNFYYKFFEQKSNNLIGIYRGAIILDLLYIEGKMKYGALIISK